MGDDGCGSFIEIVCVISEKKLQVFVDGWMDGRQLGQVWEHAPKQRVTVPLSIGTLGAYVSPFPGRCLAHTHLHEMSIKPTATMAHAVVLVAFSTHETPSLKEFGLLDQRQEIEPHVHTATADTHR